MKPMSFEELKQIATDVGELSGWDFSRMRVECAPVPWNYPDVVRQFLDPSHCVLDIGTGGGEIFLGLSPHFREGVGIDHNPRMTETAQQNRIADAVENVDFAVMEAHVLAFRDAGFDIVLNRHCSIDAAEICRVLRSDGYFITQQVASRNAQNLPEAFGWEADDEDGGQQIEEIAAEFERYGCRTETKAEYDVRYWYCDVESFVFWLKSVPIPEPFDIEKHWQGINRFIERNDTDRGIETNEHRELLTVRKP